jgi:hypothetical protein
MLSLAWLGLLVGALAPTAQARISGPSHPARRYCDAHGRPRNCIRVPRSARRPNRSVDEQGGGYLTPAEVADGGGLGGGPQEGRGPAVAWARTQIGSAVWAYRCERFIEEAYGTRYQFTSASDAARHLPLHSGAVTSVPPGSLVYFGPDRFNRGYGHVGLSLGHGLIISALDTVQVTDVAHSRYWRTLYVGWADAPPAWPGRLPSPPASTGPLISSRIQITAPAFASIVGGVVPLEASAENVGGVQFDAFYATDPANPSTRGWHILGNAVPNGASWEYDWNTSGVPNQGDPLAGTVNIAAVALDAGGRPTGTRDYRRIAINNGGGGGPAGGAPPPPTGYAETTGGEAHTWTNYANAGGSAGPVIPAFTTIQVACAISGFKVADGNTWWYRIASSPWNGAFYVSADAFYNNGQTSGSLKGTPFVDPSVPAC